MEKEINIDEVFSNLKILRDKYCIHFPEYQKAIDYAIDKIKGYRELEEENHRQRSQLMSAFDRGFIHKSKIKEIMEEIEKINFNSYTSEYDDGNIAKYYILAKFRELMEDK